jgi:hypothetical protein
MWRHRVIDLFRKEYKKGSLVLPVRYNDECAFNKWMRELYEIKWYVYLQTPSNNHKRNIEYLGRYIKRPPISETRIEKYDGSELSSDNYNYRSPTTIII